MTWFWSLALFSRIRSPFHYEFRYFRLYEFLRSLIGVVLSASSVDEMLAGLFRDEFVKYCLFAFAFAEDTSEPLHVFSDTPAP